MTTSNIRPIQRDRYCEEAHQGPTWSNNSKSYIVFAMGHTKNPNNNTIQTWNKQHKLSRGATRWIPQEGTQHRQHHWDSRQLYMKPQGVIAS